MNVLVYSGPEVLQSSLSRTLSSLRSVLYPNYTVQGITLQSLTSQPWTSSCALLVFPACREKPYLGTSISLAVRSYVEAGGVLLALRASAKTSSGILDVVDPADYTFRFLEKMSGTSVYLSFLLGGEEYTRRVAIVSVSGKVVQGVLESGKAVAGNLGTIKTAHVLARRVDGDEAVAVSLQAGEGTVGVWGVHIEAPVAGDDSSAEDGRRQLLCDTLSSLGLELPSSHPGDPSHTLPQFLVSEPTRSDAIRTILESLSANPPASFKDSHDTFAFHDSSEGEAILDAHRREQPTEDIRHIIAYTAGALPAVKLTPLFDVQQYFAFLRSARLASGLQAPLDGWGMGEVLLYGEVVSSTQTLLDRNPKFLSHLPSPVLSIGTHQLAGRGRSGNSWVSPKGCLQFSLRLRVTFAELPPTRLVFVQYLFALAVVEACRDTSVLGPLGDRIRVKWPNDVYVVGGRDIAKTTKVAGILVYTVFEGSAVDIIIGCGLNVSSPPPVASLASLVPPGEEHTLSMERIMATITTKFEGMWNVFLANKGSFEPFMDLYLDRWLHSDQAVTLTTTSPHRRVRIVGITSDHGLLRTVPDEGGFGSREFIDLQPDGNTFDLMAGLIMTKAR